MTIVLPGFLLFLFNLLLSPVRVASFGINEKSGEALPPSAVREVDVSFSAAPPKYFFSVSEKSRKKTEGETPFGKVSERECLRLPGKASLRSSGRAPGPDRCFFSILED